jgi:outer membrane protein OmpA-like peptidoglycan-associated protein
MKALLLIVITACLFCTQQLFCQSRTMKTIYFKKNQYSIDVQYKPLLKELALKSSSDSIGAVRIVGYADTTGTNACNELLSQKRAEEVYLYMKSCAKIDSTRVRVQSNGSSDEWYDLHLKGAHIQQRAVDIVLQFKSKK